MTNNEPPSLEYYPVYCFEKSPTINTWCPLRASDITALTRRRGFEGQDEPFYYLNHPIRWVRIVGVLVAINEYKGRWIYTVDDSSGTCIECTYTSPSTAGTNNTVNTGNSTTSASLQTKNPFPKIDVCMVVRVKGSLKLFREQKQIHIHDQELTHIRSTNEEIQFWDKIRTFRSNVLDLPWVLDRRIVRKLEKKNRADIDKKERAKKRKWKQQEEGASSKELVQRPFKTVSTGQSSLKKKSYRPSKLSSVMTYSEGQYDALGL